MDDDDDDGGGGDDDGDCFFAVPGKTYYSLLVLCRNQFNVHKIMFCSKVCLNPQNFKLNEINLNFTL